jgi:hypothetical protein
MRLKSAIVILALFTVLTGCATSRSASIGQLAPQQEKITTAALVSQDGKCCPPEMDSYMQQQLITYGIMMKPPLPVGTRQSADVDVIVAYSDVWRWDYVMCLQSLTINLFDGSSGNLLATGRWDNPTLHELQNPRAIIKELLDDMFSKLPASKCGENALLDNECFNRK